MEGLLVTEVRTLRQLSSEKIVEALNDESSSLELTKSLLNLLFNACFTRAIVLSRRLKTAFKTYDRLVIQVLDNSRNLQEKKHMLMRNPELVRLIAETCPPGQRRVPPSASAGQ